MHILFDERRAFYNSQKALHWMKEYDWIRPTKSRIKLVFDELNRDVSYILRLRNDLLIWVVKCPRKEIQ